MISLIPKIVLSCTLIFAGASSHAAVIMDQDAGAFDGIDVGSIDSLEGWQQKGATGWNPAGNPAGEEAWAESILGLDLNFDGKVETVSIFDTDVTGVRAFETAGLNEYFIVKNGSFRALFTNVANLAWGVIDFNMLPVGFNLNGATVSHVTALNGEGGGGGVEELPAPGVLSLFGLALLVMRRFCTKR